MRSMRDIIDSLQDASSKQLLNEVAFSGRAHMASAPLRGTTQKSIDNKMRSGTVAFQQDMSDNRVHAITSAVYKLSKGGVTGKKLKSVLDDNKPEILRYLQHWMDHQPFFVEFVVPEVYAIYKAGMRWPELKAMIHRNRSFWLPRLSTAVHQGTHDIKYSLLGLIRMGVTWPELEQLYTYAKHGVPDETDDV